MEKMQVSHEVESLQLKPWWNYLGEDIRDLLSESILLTKKVAEWDQKFEDYSFVVFPAAKAFEGFLKGLFFDLGLINEDDYYGKRFRIGKALNPSLEKKYRHHSVYDKLSDFCNGPILADVLWDTWKRSRNILFHWFPKEKNAISFSEAQDRIELIIEAINQAFTECKVNLSPDQNVSPTDK